MAFLAPACNLRLRHAQEISVYVVVVFSQTTGSAADTAERFGHFPEHAGIAVRTAFTMRDRLEEATGMQVGISIGLRLGEHHTGSHAMRLQVLHGGAGILGSTPGSDMVIQFVLVLQTTLQCGEFFALGPGGVTKR